MPLIGNKGTTKKLNATQVAQMRQAYGEGATQGSLARYFGVSAVTVGRIVRGESWVEGAGARELTQTEVDASVARVLLRVKQEELAPEMLGKSFDGPRASRPIPLSPLDGGDNPEALEGMSEELQTRARALGLDLDKELGL